MMIFDPDGELISVNDEATAWLVELPTDQRLPTDLRIDIPLWLVVMVFKAAAVRYGSGDGTARARVRSRRGPWLVCHASCLRQADGFGNTVVVIEPATPAEIAPIIIDAYDLSDREQQITRAIARGAATADIAEELYLSPHTVRDHIKEIFHKVRVSSRGELVAKLYAEYYEPLHMDGIVRAKAG
jgi:DNA-binding CsgD family transcriptional regulator